MNIQQEIVISIVVACLTVAAGNLVVSVVDSVF